MGSSFIAGDGGRMRAWSFLLQFQRDTIKVLRCGHSADGATTEIVYEVWTAARIV